MNGKINRLLMGAGVVLLLAAALLGFLNLREERASDASAQLAAEDLMKEIFPDAAVEDEQEAEDVQATEVGAQAAPSPEPGKDAKASAEPSLKPAKQSAEPTAAPEPTAKAENRPVAVEEPDFIVNPDMEMPVIEIDGYDYIGVLDLPTRDLSLPVMSDWSEEKLRISPCIYEGSIYSGDAIIAGHNYARHFSRIKTMLPGEELSFTDADGNRFFYEIVKVETIGRRGVQEMRSGEWDLTLFTCTRGGGNRLALRCRLLDYEAAGAEYAKIGRGS